MPYLAEGSKSGYADFANALVNTLTNAKSSKTDWANVSISTGLKIVSSLANIKKIDAPYLDQILYGVSNIVDYLARKGQGDKTKIRNLHNIFPGYIAVYIGGKMSNIIPFQFQPEINSDSREASYESQPYGTNEFSVYKSTTLRSLSLSTTFATTDSTLYNSHYVEGKIREIQSLVYASSHDVTKGSSTREKGLVPPPIIGLFIGDKFMRRKLPRMVYDELGTGSSLTVSDLLDKPLWNTLLKVPLLGPAIESMLMIAYSEPIYWKVQSVEVDWSDAPYNVNFDEIGVGLNVAPGGSKLPTFQKVTLSLQEHRAPSTFERRRDVDSFTSINSILARSFL